MRWPRSSHTATLTVTLSCRAFAIAASTMAFASARVSVTTYSFNESANDRNVSSASQVPRRTTQRGTCGDQSATSVVERWEQLKLVGLIFVVIDEERSILPCSY